MCLFVFVMLVGVLICLGCLFGLVFDWCVCCCVVLGYMFVCCLVLPLFFLLLVGLVAVMCMCLCFCCCV